MMQLSEAATAMGGNLHGADGKFLSVQTDSRVESQAGLFVALRGKYFDGHQYLSDAQTAGAIAAVVDHFDETSNLPQIVVTDTTAALGLLAAAWRQRFAGKVIGITGSSGKTTVKGLLHSIFAGRGPVHATPGNWNNHIGVPLTLFGLNAQPVAIVEMGTNHVGEISYLAEMAKPDVALVNNIMPAHMEGFGSLDAIAQEKSAIYAHLLPHQSAIINLDDAYAPNFLQQTGFCQQLGFAQSTESAVKPFVWASDITLSAGGYPRFTLHIAKASHPIVLSVAGLHNVQNALAAAACATAVDCTIEDIAKGLNQFGGDKGRLQISMGPQGSRIVDDTYNANPGSARAAVEFLSAFSGQTILVLGDMGELGAICDQAHAELGAIAREMKIGALYAVGEKATLAAQQFGAKGQVFETQEQLIASLENAVTQDTTVLVKGSRSAKMELVAQALQCQEKALC